MSAKLIVTGAGALVLGIIVGAATSGGDPATHEACVTALDRADEVISVNVEVHGLMADFFGTTFPAALAAAASWDVKGIESVTDDLRFFKAEIEDATDRVEKIDYRAAADECRAGGER